MNEARGECNYSMNTAKVSLINTVSLDKIEAKSHEQIEKRKQSRQSYPSDSYWMYLIKPQPYIPTSSPTDSLLHAYGPRHPVYNPSSTHYMGFWKNCREAITRIIRIWP